jgi:hypothetical protein
MVKLQISKRSVSFLYTSARGLTDLKKPYAAVVQPMAGPANRAFNQPIRAKY